MPATSTCTTTSNTSGPKLRSPLFEPPVPRLDLSAVRGPPNRVPETSGKTNRGQQMLKQVLKQVLKQNPSKAQAKSNQRQRQGLKPLSRLLILGWQASPNRPVSDARDGDVLELRASHAK